MVFGYVFTESEKISGYISKTMVYKCARVLASCWRTLLLDKRPIASAIYYGLQYNGISSRPADLIGSLVDFPRPNEEDNLK